jgi:uncharacterized protein YhaN
MRIERLSIDGFGQFFAREFGPFDPVLTIIAGPNEAGKSTLVAFITNVLFGFQQKDEALHVPALAGGRHGGRLSVIDDAGNRYVIQRHAGPGRSQGHVVVTKEDGSPAEDGVLTRLLSAATPDLFRSAFAFDLEQLQSLRAADNTDISAAIYGAGLGVKNLSQTIAKFDDRMGAIFKPRGSIQPIEEIRRKLEDIDQRLLDISKNADKYDALLARREKAGLESEAILQRMTAIRDKQRKIERVQQGWADWVRLAMFDEQLAKLPLIENFPEDALARLEKAEAEVRAAQVEYETAEQHLDGLLEHAAAIHQDDAVFAHDEAIIYLRENRTTVATTVNDLPGLRAQADQDQAQQEATLRELGAGWSEQRALSFDVSIPVRNTVQQHKQTLQQDEQAWRAAKETEATRAADFKEAKRKVQELSDAGVAADPANSADLRLRRRVLTTLRDQWSQLLTLKQSHERAVAAASVLRPSSVAGEGIDLRQQWSGAREDIQRYRQVLEAAEQRVQMTAAAVAARQSDLDEAEADAERARSAAAGLQRPPLDTDALRDQQRLLSQARRLEAELGTRRDLLRSEEEQLAGLRSRSHEGGAEARSAAVPPALIYGLALAGIAGIAAGVVLSGNILWPGVGAGSVLLAVAIVLHFVSTSTPSASPISYDPVAQQEQRVKTAREQVAAAEARLRDALRPLVTATQAPPNLDAVEQELTAAQTALATWAEAQAAIRRAEDDVIRRRRTHEASRRSQEQAEQGRTEALRGWGTWLVEHGLDPSATTDRVLDFVGAWERAEAAGITVAEAAAKLADAGRSLARNGTVDEAALNAEEQAIDEAESALREWEQRQAAFRAATEDAASKRRLLEGATDTVAQAAAKLAADQDAWAAWLQTVGLDVSYQPDTVLEMMHKLDTVRERHAVILQRRQAVERSKRTISRYRETLTTALSLLGESSPGATHADLLGAADDLIGRYDAAVAARSLRTQAEAEVERATQDLARRTHDLDRTRRGLGELLEIGGVADSEAFRRRAREQAEQIEAEHARTACLLHLQTLSGPEPAWSAYREDLRATEPDTVPERLQQLTDELAALEKERNELLEERGRIDLETKQLEGDVRASELRAQRADLVEQLHSHAREWAGLAVAKHLMERARQTYEREAQPAVIREARSFFSAITEGRYDNIYVPLEPTGGRQRTEIWATQPGGNRKAPRELSRGTREQLYISLRFGLIRNLGEQQERLPVIVDDVLVNFDPDRAARAAEAFAQLAETHQVLVLTCHSTTVERFLAAAPRAHILNLEGKEASFPVVAGGVPNDG